MKKLKRKLKRNGPRGLTEDSPILQAALDFVDLPRALRAAKEAVAGGADWLEAGTPLIKSEGIKSVRELRKMFPRHKICADMKTVDAGRAEVEMALKAGAHVVHVLASASDSTISECVEAARNYGGEIMVDLIDVQDPLKRALELEKLGVQYLDVHVGIDQQMKAQEPFKLLKRICSRVRIPVAVAGGINSETAAKAVEAGARIVIVGGAITKAKDASLAASQIKKAILERTVIPTQLYKRVLMENVREALNSVSTPNLSDAMHRSGDLQGLSIVTNGVKMVGPAVTVRTYPGDWAKPVEAIDTAKKGDVIVIDAGGAPPAVWGELATHSSLVKKISGVVIDGAIRDTPEIKKLQFPAFAKHITPTAGEPKGFGEINIPVTIGGVKVYPGDWVVGDDDGVVVLPKEKTAEIANRAMDVLERENRLRREIQDGSTLSQVGYLEKWEKKG